MATENESRLPTPSRTWNRIQVGFGILLAIGMLGFVISQWVYVAKFAGPADTFTKKLSNQGLSSGTPKEVSPTVKPPADKVFEIKINGHAVWVCSFDPKVKAGADSLEKIREQKTIEIDGKAHPARVNGSLVLAGHDDHPDKEKIVKAFDELDKP